MLWVDIKYIIFNKESQTVQEMHMYAIYKL